MNERNLFIVRFGEAALKGQNKPYFEKLLVERIRKLVKRLGSIEVRRKEGLIFVRADKSIPQEDIIREIGKVFGIASISPAVECPSDLEEIGRAAVEYMNRLIQEKGVKTFKVEARRQELPCQVS